MNLTKDEKQKVYWATWYKENREKRKKQRRAYHHAFTKASPENKIHSLLWKAKSRAKRNGWDFCITAEDLIATQWCPLLGIKICYSNDKTKPNSPSIDRIDASRGYVPGNVWIISHKANVAKNDLSIEQLETLVANLRAEIEGRET